MFRSCDDQNTLFSTALSIVLYSIHGPNIRFTTFLANSSITIRKSVDDNQRSNEKHACNLIYCCSCGSELLHKLAKWNWPRKRGGFVHPSRIRGGRRKDGIQAHISVRRALKTQHSVASAVLLSRLRQVATGGGLVDDIWTKDNDIKEANTGHNLCSIWCVVLHLALMHTQLPCTLTPTTLPLWSSHAYFKCKKMVTSTSKKSTPKQQALNLSVVCGFWRYLLLSYEIFYKRHTLFSSHSLFPQSA